MLLTFSVVHTDYVSGLTFVGVGSLLTFFRSVLLHTVSLLIILSLLQLSAFLSTSTTQNVKVTELNARIESIKSNNIGKGRRNALIKSMLISSSAFVIASSQFAQGALAVDDDLTRGGVQLSPFNGLTFNYRGNSNNGLDASTLSEPSVPYVDFLTKLDAGEVEFVEFLAPNGDAAYATFKAKDGEAKMKPIRIGEGYPIEDPEGWSSPAFVVKVSFLSFSTISLYSQ